MKLRTLVIASMLSLGLVSHASAATYEINAGEDLWGRLSSLAAGDIVIVHAGTYTQTSRFEATWPGTEAMPIVVRAADGEARPVLTRDAAQNLMNLHGSWFTFRGFELTGGSHGLRLSDVDHSTFEDLLIHDTDDVGISCNVSDAAGDPNGCSSIVIRGCEIHHTNGTGEGLYLGCNSGACVFSDSLIERNYIHDLGGSQGDGIEIKGGSYGNVVRDNVIVRSNYPGITLYTFDAAAGRMPNVIERNLVWHTIDNGIQVTGRAIVRNNIVVDAGASGIASQPNQGTPSDLEIVHNTVVGASDACFRANGWDGATGFVVANNAFYCEASRAIRITSATTAIIAGNVVLGAVEGATTGFTTGASLTADLGTETALARVYPPTGSELLDAGDTALAAADDFDLRARGAMPDVGAYERNGTGMPAWLVVEDFKLIEGTPIDVDGGGVTGDAGPLADGGPGSDGGPGTDGGPGSDSGASGRDAGSSAAAPAGCACRVGHGSAGGGLAIVLFALASLVARRRFTPARRR